MWQMTIVQKKLYQWAEEELIIFIVVQVGIGLGVVVFRVVDCHLVRHPRREVQLESADLWYKWWEQIIWSVFDNGLLCDNLYYIMMWWERIICFLGLIAYPILRSDVMFRIVTLSAAKLLSSLSGRRTGKFSSALLIDYACEYLRHRLSNLMDVQLHNSSNPSNPTDMPVPQLQMASICYLHIGPHAFPSGGQSGSFEGSHSPIIHFLFTADLITIGPFAFVVLTTLIWYYQWF